MANTFIKQYCPQNIPQTSPYIHDHTNVISTSIFIEPTTPVEVFNTINGAKNTVVCLDCDIPQIVWKYISDITSDILSTLINRVFDTGIFPDILKTTKIIPLYKKEITHIQQITDRYPLLTIYQN